MTSGPPPPDKLRRIARVAQVFTPGAPIDDYSLFGGRKEQVMDVINTWGRKGQHVILYGERGVGKTSLANILAEVFRGLDDAQLGAVGINCHTNDDFESLWSNVFEALGRAGHVITAESVAQPEQVRFALEQLDLRTLVIIDELDRLEDDVALSLLADTVKTLSDHAVQVTLVLVGVADSVDELVGDHYSIARALTQIHLPRMSARELEDIIDRGLAELELKIDDDARHRIATLSEGLPYYTHSLSLHAGQHAIADDRDAIVNNDVTRAVDLAVRKTQHSIQTAFERATRSPRNDTLFEEALLACALAPKGPLGFFAAGAVREPMSRILGSQVDISKFNRHLNAFATPARATVLQKTGEARRFFFRFVDPLMQPFVILKGLADGRIDEALVSEMQSAEQAPPELF